MQYIDESLLEYCKTKRQEEVLRSYLKHNDIAKVSEELATRPSYIKRIINNLLSVSSKKGNDKKHNIGFPLADWETMGGRSALVNEQKGEIVLQWYKTKEDKTKTRDMILSTVNALASEIKPSLPKPIPAIVSEDLLSCYILTDYHLGMMAKYSESGTDWDLDIAEETLYRYFDEAIDMTPPSKHAVLAQLGDFLHFDGLMAVTPTSQHVLDSSSRFYLMIEAAVRVIRKVLDKLLCKHQEVTLLMMEGNHDIASSFWLREFFHILYENEPRIFVEKSPKPYTYIEHGKTSLFFHHGHLKKMNDVSSVFASLFREVFGRTEFSYGHIGHYHHSKVIENSLMTIEQHQTLTPKDAHSSRHGYMSDRSGQVITYHKRSGEVSRIRVRPII